MRCDGGGAGRRLGKHVGAAHGETGLLGSAEPVPTAAVGQPGTAGGPQIARKRRPSDCPTRAHAASCLWEVDLPLLTQPCPVPPVWGTAAGSRKRKADALDEATRERVREHMRGTTVPVKVGAVLVLRTGELRHGGASQPTP